MGTAIEIVFEDEHLLVCGKSAGLAVQSAKSTQPDLESMLRNRRTGKGEPPEIYVVHRLDQPVEGLLVVAKTQKAAAGLSKELQQGFFTKTYRAVVEGIPPKSQGTIENYLLRDGRTNTSKVVSKETKGAKKAVLRYTVLDQRIGDSGETAQSLLEIHLETGRHHQIRVQLAHAGYPLAGDKKYNPNCGAGYLPIGLCSTELAFTHPITGEAMSFIKVPQGQVFRSFQSE